MAAPIPAQLVPQNNQIPMQQQKKPGFWENVGNYFLGTPGGYKQQLSITPQQQQLQNQAIQQTMQLLQNLGQGANFEPIEQLARTNFQQKTIPSIAERFTRMGGQGSGAFQQTLGEAGSNLEQGLAALKSQHGLQQQQQLERLLPTLLGFSMQNPYESFYEEPQSGALPGLLQGLGSLGLGYLTGGGSLIPSLLGGLGGLFSSGRQQQQPMQQQQAQLTPQGLAQRLNSLQQRNRQSINALFPSLGNLSF